MKQRIIRWVFATCMLAAVADAEAQAAKSVLEAAGVRGGVIVHLGCGDGRLTPSLRLNEGYCVQGLDADPKNVARARQYVRSQGVYGGVSIDAFDGRNLPYVDNMVNLLIAGSLGEVPILVRAMTLAGETLFVAGPEDLLQEEGTARDKQEQILKQEAALLGNSGAVLWALSAQDGAKLHEYKLASAPVFDGMAAANGRLYLATTNGRISCWHRP